MITRPDRPRWRDRSDTILLLRWYRARLRTYLHLRAVQRRSQRYRRHST